MCHKFYFCRALRLKAHPAPWAILKHEHHHPLHLCASPSTDMEVLLLFSLRIATETLLCMKEDFFLIKAQPHQHWHPIKQEWMFPTNSKESTGRMPHSKKIGGLNFINKRQVPSQGPMLAFCCVLMQGDAPHHILISSELPWGPAARDMKRDCNSDLSCRTDKA